MTWYHEGVLKVSGCSVGWIYVLDDGLSVEVRGPVDQVEAAEQYGEHDAGDAVDLTDAVERLLALLSFGLARGLGAFACRAFGDGGQRGVLGDVGGVVSHSDSIRVVLLHEGRFLFLQEEQDVSVKTPRSTESL